VQQASHDSLFPQIEPTAIIPEYVSPSATLPVLIGTPSTILYERAILPVPATSITILLKLGYFWTTKVSISTSLATRRSGPLVMPNRELRAGSINSDAPSLSKPAIPASSEENWRFLGDGKVL
jgi:hypothetical protein